ncbi:Pvc16 family protein [Streptomyces erythrochromogenes]|uniref:Pvc16 family protein n=1 Tax=Streptomyces erythrochromogenes TaxID=285574 RepID=UPI003417A7EF
MLLATSAALCRLLETALAGRCAVTAEPPAGALTAPPDASVAPRGVGVHLFHVAATGQGLPADGLDMRDERGRVVGRRAAVRRYRTRWLVWSWAPTAVERLELLDEALDVLGAGLVLPEEVAGPELAAGGPVHLETAPAAGTAADHAGVFAGLGVPARPAVEVVLTAGSAPVAEEVAAPPVDVRVVARPRPLRRRG